MALPKSMRYLAAATLCIFVFIFVQLLNAPQTELHLPNSGTGAYHGKYVGDRDPQLDRTDSIPSIQLLTCTDQDLQRRANRLVYCTALTARTTRRARRIVHASTPLS